MPEIEAIYILFKINILSLVMNSADIYWSVIITDTWSVHYMMMIIITEFECCLHIASVIVPWFCLQLSTKFAGVASAPNMQNDKLFQCQVILEGPSVLEGIRQMVEAGVTDTTLPNHVANIKSLHRNKVLIRQKATSSDWHQVSCWCLPRVDLVVSVLTGISKYNF